MIIKRHLIIFIHIFIGWTLCGATIGISRKITTLDNALMVHAVAVPIIFGAISFIYFKKFNFTKPLPTAFAFMLFAIFMDAAIVAPLIEKSFDMFTSVIGTWVPFALIFISTLVTGIAMNKSTIQS